MSLQKSLGAEISMKEKNRREAFLSIAAHNKGSERVNMLYSSCIVVDD